MTADGGGPFWVPSGKPLEERCEGRWRRPSPQNGPLLCLAGGADWARNGRSAGARGRSHALDKQAAEVCCSCCRLEARGRLGQSVAPCLRRRIEERLNGQAERGADQGLEGVLVRRLPGSVTLQPLRSQCQEAETRTRRMTTISMTERPSLSGGVPLPSWPRWAS